MQGQFSQALKDAEYLIWREALCQGPITYVFHDLNQINKRKSYLESLDSSIQILEGSYLFEQLQDYHWGYYKSIYLWFEPDLFCQINQIAAISYFLQQNSSLTIYAIPISEFDAISKATFSQFEQNDFTEMQNRFYKLNSSDLEAVDELWKSITSGITDVNQTSISLPFISKNLSDWISQTTELGIGALLYKKAIIEMCEIPKVKKDLIRTLLTEYSELGFGDLQIEYIISQMIDQGKISFTPNKKLVTE